MVTEASLLALLDGLDAGTPRYDQGGAVDEPQDTGGISEEDLRQAGAQFNDVQQVQTAAPAPKPEEGLSEEQLRNMGAKFSDDELAHGVTEEQLQQAGAQFGEAKPKEGMVSAVGAGLSEGLTSAAQGVGVLQGDRSAHAVPEHDFTLPGKLTYGLFKSAPMLAGGILGGLIGSAVGPLGTLGVGALGAALGSGVVALGEAYQRELARTPDDSDAAYQRALESSAISAAGGGLSWAAFPVGVTGGIIKHIITQGAVQGGISGGEQIAHNVHEGEPFQKDLGTALAEGALSTATLMGGHAAVKAGVKAWKGKETAATTPPPSPSSIAQSVQAPGSGASVTTAEVNGRKATAVREAAASEPPKVAAGTSQAQPPPRQNVTSVGNQSSQPSVRDGGNTGVFAKQKPAGGKADVVTVEGLSPEQAAALAESVGRKPLPPAKPVEEPGPAQPGGETQPPIDTGLVPSVGQAMRNARRKNKAPALSVTPENRPQPDLAEDAAVAGPSGAQPAGPAESERVMLTNQGYTPEEIAKLTPEQIKLVARGQEGPVAASPRGRAPMPEKPITAKVSEPTAQGAEPPAPPREQGHQTEVAPPKSVGEVLAKEKPAAEPTPPTRAAEALSGHTPEMLKAIKLATQNKMADLAKRLREMPRDNPQYEDAAKKINEQLEGKETVTRKEQKAAARPVMEELGVQARSHKDAERKLGAINAAKQAVAEHPPKDSVIPVDKTGVTALRERLQQMLEKARELNGGEDPNDTYKPRVKPAEMQLLKLARRLQTNQPKPKDIRDFIAAEKALRSGDKEAALEVQRTGTIEASIKKSRRSGDQAVESATAAREDVHQAEDRFLEKTFEHPAEDAEEFVKPKPVLMRKNAAGKLEPVHDDTMKDLTDRTTIAENLAKMAAEEEARAAQAKEHEVKPGEEDKGARAEMQKKAKPIWEQDVDAVEKKMAAQRAAREAAGKKLAPREHVDEAALRGEEPKENMRTARLDETLTRTTPTPKHLLKEFAGNESGSLNYPKIKNMILTRARPILEHWIKYIQPEMKSEPARWADPKFAKFAAGKAASYARILRETDAWYHAWEKEGKDAGLQYMDDMENGRPQSEPWKKAAAELDRHILDTTYELEAEHGSTAEYVDNYYPHMWEKPKEAKQFIENRIQQMGPTWFQKQRVIDLIKEGVDAGLKLRTTNPSDLVSMRAKAGAHMMRKVELLRGLGEMGLAYPVSNLPNGMGHNSWQRVIGPDRQTWALAPDVEHLWTNAVDAKGLFDAANLAGSAFRGWMQLKNVWVPIKLMLSAFHPLHVWHININDNMMREFAVGGLRGLLKGAGQGIADPLLATRWAERLPFGVGEASRNFVGKEVRRGWVKPPEQQTAQEKYYNGVLEEMGIIPQQNEQLRIAAKRDLAKIYNLNRGASGLVGNIMDNPIGALTTPIRRTIEMIQAPVFEHWIPALKTAAALRSAAALMQRHPEYIHDETARSIALRALGKQVDDRFGEMFYGSLFLNRYVKDAGVGSFLSLSWNLGLTRQAGGAVLNPIRTAAEKLGAPRSYAGKIVYDATNKTAYATSYTMTGLMLGGAMTAALTGTLPSEWLDYVFPRVGGENPDGSPRRATTMFFTREYEMVKHHIQESESVLGGVAQTIWDKMILAPMVDIYKNRNFMGNELYRIGDWLPKQVIQALYSVASEAFNPIVVSGAARARQSGGGKLDEALSYLGFGPAPAYGQRDALGNAIMHRFNVHVAPHSKPYDDQANAQLRREARGELDLAKKNQDQAGIAAAVKKLMDTGMDPKTIKKLSRPEQDLYFFSRLPLSDKKDLVDRYMNDDQFKRYVLQNKQMSKKEQALLANQRRKQNPNQSELPSR